MNFVPIQSKDIQIGMKIRNNRLIQNGYLNVEKINAVTFEGALYNTRLPDGELYSASSVGDFSVAEESLVEEMMT